jgi:SAM-dependent methyltransferase
LLLHAGCVRLLGDRPPFEPTPPAIVRAMLEMASVGPGDVVLDLGSGDGRIAIAAAANFGARAVGIEIDPALVSRARAAARQAGVADRVEFRVGDMYGADLAGATVVTLFLNPRPNLKLRPKLRTSLPKGGRVVSYLWDMGDWHPDAVQTVDGKRILLWHISGKPHSESDAGTFPSTGSHADYRKLVREVNIKPFARSPPSRGGLYSMCTWA